MEFDTETYLKQLESATQLEVASESRAAVISNLQLIASHAERVMRWTRPQEERGDE